MNKNGILLWLFITVLLTAGMVKAEVPEGHKPTPCFGCHVETLGVGAGPGECGNCHYYKLPAGGFNVKLLQSEHNPKICKACHMGNTLVNASERDLFHNGHNAVNCTQCHTENDFTVIKIEHKGFECVSCHGNQVHGIHVRNLNNICSVCHGSWAQGRVYTNTSPSSSTSLNNSKLERFTIFAFIKNLLNSILGMNINE